MEETFRDGLRAALTEAQSADVAPVSDAVESPAAPDASESAAAPASGDDGAAESTPAPDGRARDSSGKFTKAEESVSATPKKQKVVPTSPTVRPVNGAASPTQAPAPGIQTPTPPPKFRAPQSWTPSAREKWDGLPPEIQAEVDRVNREYMKSNQEAAKPREFHQQFQQAVAPYQAMIQASGADTVKYVSDLMGTAYALQSGAPQQRAMAAAQIIKNFGVDISMLDAALAGEAPQPGQAQHFDANQIAAQVREQVMRDFQQRQQQAIAQRAAKEVEDFGASREFFDDVCDDMGRRIEDARARGVAMSLEDAYDEACWAHKPTRKVLQQREAHKAATAPAAVAATQRARAASSSVKSEPTGTSVSGEGSGTYRDELRRQMAERNRG